MASYRVHYSERARVQLHADGAMIRFDSLTHVLCQGGLAVPVLASERPADVNCDRCRRRRAFPESSNRGQDSDV